MSASFLSLHDLNQNLERFWQIDEFTANNQRVNDDDEYCEDYFQRTTTRDRNGKFIVRIPFKPTVNELGNSYDIALARFKGLEKRFKTNPTLKTGYTKFMQEYRDLNHMSITKTNDAGAFYLPHHAIIRESSATKLRVVFDGSCKLVTGLTINDVQFTGPTLQNDIFSIIARFRLHQYVLTADVEKMYRMVWVHPEHRKYQRILWRENPSDEISVYELNTVTYGTTSAPYLAIRSLIQIALDNQERYPLESRIIQEDFYVDDLITGAKSREQLTVIKSNLCNILTEAGFQLRKFSSNIHELGDQLSREQSSLSLSNGEHKLLGVCWDPARDTFSYSVQNLVNQPQVTKRTILAVTAQLYDPLGLLAPVIVIAKLIIQELWQLNLN